MDFNPGHLVTEAAALSALSQTLLLLFIILYHFNRQLLSDNVQKIDH